MSFIADVASDLGIDLDADNDGAVTIDELVDEVAERIDDLLAFSGVAELVTDLGIKAFAWAAVAIFSNRVQLLRRRLARNRDRLAALETGAAA